MYKRQLWYFANGITAFLAALTLTSYVFVYTPMKTRSPLSTIVGAIPGALPPLGGYTAAAGHVIEGLAEFIMGGNLLLGLVVFLVLLIVNFVVITKGAGRMAEVGARFALDGMPGKQLAIDADMAAGAIDHAEARQRREQELAETNFFGSLDGASKFVKGDAVAGLLITLLNIVVGLLMGVLAHGMALGEAFETYAILTVGDGLVSQIPAVIISIAAALLLARGGATGSTDTALLAQLGRHPTALLTVALLMMMFALVPGLPFWPFVTGAAVLGATEVDTDFTPQGDSVDTFVYNAASDSTAAAMDSILKFNIDAGVGSVDDIIDLSVFAGDANGALDSLVTNNTAAANFAALVTSANAADQDIWVGRTATDAYVFIDHDEDLDVDMVIKLVGVNDVSGITLGENFDVA